MTDLIARCARLGWELRKDGDGYELLGNGQPAAFRSAASVAAWLERREKEKGAQRPVQLRLDLEEIPA